MQVTTQPAQTSIGSVLLNLLPLALILGLFLWTGRSGRRQLAGLGGIGRSRAKVFDAERPETTLPFISVTGSSFVELFVGATGHSATAMPAGEPATATRT